MSALVADADARNTVRSCTLPIDPSDQRVRPDVIRPDRVPLERLDVDGLTVSYGQRPVLHEVSFTVRRGEFVVISGPVGAGKSSLLRALLGLAWQADVSGSIRWNGAEIGDRSAFLVPPNAAFLSQVPQLISDSIADNVSLGPADVEALDRAFRLAAIADDIAALPDGAATLIGPRGLRLSGGQRQRLATARALVHSPELVVLDDLSSALDVETEVQLWSESCRCRHDGDRRVASRRGVRPLPIRCCVSMPVVSFAERLTVPRGSGRALAPPVVGGVGAAGAARVGTEPPGAVAGHIVEEVLAVAGGAGPESCGAVVAHLLRERHQEVGDCLIVERR